MFLVAVNDIVENYGDLLGHLFPLHQSGSHLQNKRRREAETGDRVGLLWVGKIKSGENRGNWARRRKTIRCGGLGGHRRRWNWLH